MCPSVRLQCGADRACLHPAGCRRAACPPPQSCLRAAAWRCSLSPGPESWAAGPFLLSPVLTTWGHLLSHGTLGRAPVRKVLGLGRPALTLLLQRGNTVGSGNTSAEVGGPLVCRPQGFLFLPRAHSPASNSPEGHLWAPAVEAQRPGLQAGASAATLDAPALCTPAGVHLGLASSAPKASGACR